ncbi:vanomycin resistance protein VanB [Clostridium sp. chh4-2]|uniref:VanW family protein n=1 Tax=Clostridium sp. chh4-2 TaxID=2067550 RepID=UPI000CCE525E|nr:VanW family protein [Clostridium sp. chh4-2]PNV59341.1 vanomycin resistance protein VanB [Clostridium sp. chh4-2]
MSANSYNRKNSSRRKTSGSGRSYSSRGSAGSSRRGGRRRKPAYDYTKIAIGGVLLIIVILCVVLVAKTMGKKKAEETSETTTTVIAETELQKDVIVDGITITGMSINEAKDKILKQYPWNMKVIYEGKEPYEVKDLMAEKVDILLNEIYHGEPKETYTLDTTGLEDAVKEEAKAAAKVFDVPAKNGSISGFDKDTAKFIYSGEQNGLAIDQEKLASDIQAALDKKDFSATIKADGKVTIPEITEAQAKEMYKVIGTFTTTTTSNKDRNTNIRIACEALNGLIIQPGEEFSFNNTTGNRTTDKGYRPAGAYSNGILVEEPGGGVCQVSSTLYNAVVFSGLTTTERHAHSYEPSYVTPGEDAMVSYDGYAGPDMKFVNNSPSAVAIRTKFESQKLTISIVGIPILEEGVVLSMHSEKTAELDPPAPVYEEDQTLQPGVEVEAKKATNGSRWITNLIVKRNGVVESDEFFHSSTYKGKSATIKRNTSGVVIPAETSEGSSESGSSVQSSESGTAETSEGVQQAPGEPDTQPSTTAPHETAAPSTSPAGPGPGTETNSPSSPVIDPNPMTPGSSPSGPGV